jgi:hypothetical protein
LNESHPSTEKASAFGVALEQDRASVRTVSMAALVTLAAPTIVDA